MAWVNTSPLVKTWTLEEFWELPEPPDRSKLELIAGVLYMTPPPAWSHSTVVARLIRLLSAHLIETCNPGTLHVPRAAIWTSRATYLEPDLFFISAELAARLDPRYPVCADLVIEITSPGSAMYDRNTKADTYGALGVRELWLVDETDENVEVRRQSGEGFGERQFFSGEEVLVSAVLPDLLLPVAALFSA